jgi:hypothetical protein
MATQRRDHGLLHHRLLHPEPRPATHLNVVGAAIATVATSSVSAVSDRTT